MPVNQLYQRETYIKRICFDLSSFHHEAVFFKGKSVTVFRKALLHWEKE